MSGVLGQKLGRNFGVAEGAVGAVVEPLGVLFDVGVVGGALERDVEGDLQAQVVGRLDEPVERLNAAQFGVDALVPAL